MHSGEIWVESTGYDPLTCPGSTFHIFLPSKPRTSETPFNYTDILK
jgi:hypothetical protein